MITANGTATVEKIGEHYDAMDSLHRRVCGLNVHHGYFDDAGVDLTAATDKLNDLIAEKAQLRPGDRVCDIGCGYGETARTLAHRFGARVTALTVSKAQYDYAQSVRDGGDGGDGGAQPEFLLQDWYTNSFADESFDAVISIESLFYFDDPQRFFNEVRRVLKPGGRAVIAAWLSGKNPWPWAVRYLLEPICREVYAVGMGDRDEYAAMAERAGLRVLDNLDLSSNVKRTFPAYMRKAIRVLATDGEARQSFVRAMKSDLLSSKTQFRIWAAYEVRAMEYGLFVLGR